MRRLHLKLFYLRTRLKREAQGITARTLGVRPATMSHLEQGRSIPTLSMLHALCRHYDVTPTYLLDDERPIEPGPQDRWNERNSVVARGNWLEVPETAMVTAADGTRLCPVLNGARFYDAAAQAQRLVCSNAATAKELEVKLIESVRRRDHELEASLQHELMGQRKPRHAKRAKAPGKMAGALAHPAAEV